MDNTYCYEVNLLWNSTTLGTLSSPIISSTIEVVTPPEFPRGIKEKWTPEHMFVASINACLMSTFLLIADNSKLVFTNYESNAVGKIEKVDGKFVVTEIVIEPKVVISKFETEDRVKHILEMSEKACVIANSIKTKIIVEPLVTVQ
jgi:organic hydroperoxide reductase OsmC/OhrA